jgi:hypothetical protein
MQKLESSESDKMRTEDPEVANSPDSAAQNVIPMYELKWSHVEKTVARRAFDRRLAKNWKLSSRKLKAEPRGSRNRRSCGIWKAG